MSKKKDISGDHHHLHDHSHSHLPSDPELRVKAVETLLLNKGLIDTKTLDELIDTYENRIGPKNGAKVVLHRVINPENFGVALVKGKKIVSIKEKPKKFISNLAITGLYFLDNRVVEFAKQLKPSKRNELEIVDLLNKYKKQNKLSAEFLGRGGAWLDTGSIDDFYKTSNFVSAIENRQGFKIACIEEISLQNKWIKRKEILNSIKFYGNCEYSKYLKKLITK